MIQNTIWWNILPERKKDITHMFPWKTLLKRANLFIAVPATLHLWCHHPGPTLAGRNSQHRGQIKTSTLKLAAASIDNPSVPTNISNTSSTSFQQSIQTNSTIMNARKSVFGISRQKVIIIKRRYCIYKLLIDFIRLFSFMMKHVLKLYKRTIC